MSDDTSAVAAAIEQQGFAVVDRVVSENARIELAAMFAEGNMRAGRRDGLRYAAVLAVARSEPVRTVVEATLGVQARAVRATLFDKTPTSNWLVPWHQDVTIPVRERREVDGYEAWSLKGGVPHVRPPRDVLESMLAVRIDLDGSLEDSGALRVIAGTHTSGFMAADEIQEIRRARPYVERHVPVRAALVMRPLLLHASSHAREARHRRVVHLEFAGCDLDGGLEWYDWRRPGDSMDGTAAACD